MQMTVARVAEDHGGHAPALGRGADRRDILTQPCQWNTAILDHLQGTSLRRQARQDGTCRMAQHPELLFLVRCEGRRDIGRDLLHSPDGVAHDATYLSRIIPFELHQQDRFRPLGYACRLAPRATLLSHQVQEGAVEQLHRRGMQGDQCTDGRLELFESVESDPQPGTRCRNRIEPPADRRDQAEGAFGPDEEVEVIARGKPGVERVAGGVFPGAGESGGDGIGGGTDGGGGIAAESVDRYDTGRDRDPTIQPDHVAVRRHNFQRIDPASCRPIPDRPRPRRIGRGHAAERCPATAGRIGGEPETVRRGGGVELVLGDVGAGDRAATGRIDLEPTRHPLTQVDDDPRTDGVARNPASGTAGGERSPALRSPAHQCL